MDDDDVVFVRWTSATTAMVKGCARWSEANYAAGFLFKPHYSVPALRADVTFCPDSTVYTVWPVNDDEGHVRVVHVTDNIHGTWVFGSYDD